MKYIKRTAIILAVALIPSLGVAIDPTTSGRIIDNFKDQQKEILFESLPFSESGATMILEQEYIMNGLDGLRSRISLVQGAYTSKKTEITEHRKTLEEALEILDKTIAQSEANIELSNKRIREKDLKAQELSQMLIDISKKIYVYRETILSYLANIYAEGNVVFSDSGDIDIVKWLILSDGDTDGILSDMTYKSLVTILWQKFVDEYRLLKKEYYVLRIQVEEERAGIASLKKEFELQKAFLEEQRIERVRLVEVTKWQEALYQDYIQAQEQALIAIEQVWKKAETDYQKWLSSVLEEAWCNSQKKNQTLDKKCENITLYFANERELKKIEYSTGTENIFSWPVEWRRISAFFRDAEYYHYVRSHHDAIDIAVPQSSDVRAPATWYVYYVLPPSPGGYSYMALKHKDGLMTVYGHLSETLVSEWQFIQAGELIAKSGWAVGTPGAGPMTSGPHLHFEVWKNKEPVDPLRYMDISGIDYENMPTRYQDKFITDFIEGYGSGADTSKYERKFIIRGETEKERQEFLLKTYATPDFQSWDMWVDTALEWGIDPSFMMCIGLAETTLGNRLKTAYNIGNIGNTDSGGTYSFTSPQEWVSWMTATFNNRFLGKYTKLSELSRWGNPDGAIYASSNSNWHNNTVRCLSALKWRFVEDDFEFRVKE
jgi:murein DD-endopeptidase MepM/ murein hydrolase activator NlpD